MVILTPSLRGRVLGSWPNVRYWLDRVLRQPAAWYAGFAVYAACVALFSGPGLDHWWGTWAACGYAVAAAIAVGIALASEPSQLSQQISYSPARGLAPVPGGSIEIPVRAEYVVNHRTRLDVSFSPCILPCGRGNRNFSRNR